MTLPVDIALTGAAITSTEVLLNWTDSSGTADIYQVQRDSSQIATIDLPIETYTDNTAVVGALYNYQIFGISTAGNNFTQIYESNAEEIQMPNFTGTAFATLTWAPGTPGTLPLIGYRINRSNFATGPFETIAIVGPKVLTYIDDTVNQGITYWYDIVAVAENFYSESEPSQILSVDVPEIAFPSAPVLVSVVTS